VKVTYIRHSCFLAETAGCSLLFDYYEGNLPPIPGDRPLYIFASHSHGDHYSRAVFDIAASHGNARCILSSDIHPGLLPSSVRNRVISLRPHQTWQDDILHVETLESNDAGVAFWVTDGSVRIYHAGDLNNWYWDGDAEDAALAKRYHRELSRIAGRHADAAFIPLDPRLKRPELGILDFLSRCSADAVFPMHQWGNYQLTDEVLKMPAMDPYRDRIRVIRKEGQEFLLHPAEK
jgi:L-ascorbate metabolism protein UlaG (beta-lactamase superfamily)